MLTLLYFNFFNYDKNLSVKSMYFCTWAFLMLFKQSEPYLTVLQHRVKVSQYQEFLCLKHTIMEKKTFITDTRGSVKYNSLYIVLKCVCVYLLHTQLSADLL